MVRALERQPSAIDDRINYNPGFPMPMPGFTGRGITPMPPIQASEWTPWVHQSPYSPPTQQNSISHTIANLSFTTPSPPQRVQPLQKSPSPPASSLPSLTAPLPSLSQLQAAVPAIKDPAHNPALKTTWCRDVFFLVDHALSPTAATDPPTGPAVISDPQLAQLAKIAAPTVLQLASNTATPMPPHVAEALYMKAVITANGSYPEFARRDPRGAFRDFEAAAKGGFATAWFRLGKDYETFNDPVHARECYERGAKLGDEACIYVRFIQIFFSLFIYLFVY